MYRAWLQACTIWALLLTITKADKPSYVQDVGFMAGDYGTYPVHKFKTSNIEPPRFNFEAPFSSCDDGSYIFFSPRGNVVSATFYIYDHE